MTKKFSLKNYLENKVRESGKIIGIKEIEEWINELRFYGLYYKTSNAERLLRALAREPNDYSNVVRKTGHLATYEWIDVDILVNPQPAQQGKIYEITRRLTKEREEKKLKEKGHSKQLSIF